MLTANLEIWLGLLRQEPQDDPFFAEIRSELEDISQVLDRAIRQDDTRGLREFIQTVWARHKPTGGATKPQTCRYCGKQLP